MYCNLLQAFIGVNINKLLLLIKLQQAVAPLCVIPNTKTSNLRHDPMIDLRLCAGEDVRNGRAARKQVEIQHLTALSALAPL